MSKTRTLTTHEKRVDSDTDTDDSDNQEDDQDSTKDDHEDADIEKPANIYKENFWPSKPEIPKGFTFKGKHKLMTFAVNKAKTLLKRKDNVEIGRTKFNIKDNRIVGGATQVVIEIVDKEGRGNAIVELWGPNKRKECTVLVKKSKEHDERFVEIVAKAVVQPILDCLITGGDSKSLFKNTRKNSKSQPKTKIKKKCQLCEKSFMSEKYLNIHISKLHKEKRNNKCSHCDYTDSNGENLKTHMSKHCEQNEPMIVSSLSKKDSVSPEISGKISFEEKRIDDTIMDTTETIATTRDELAERSKFRDEKIREKERKREEEEQKYNEIKRKREESSELKRKKTSSKKKKKKKTSPPLNEPTNLPPNIRPVPENIKHLVESDDFMLCVKPDGACGFNSTAGHILEDPDQGPKLRRVINRHLCDRWENYKDKYDFPYSRQVGAQGDWVHFENSKDFLEYLKNDSKADYLWTDSQELHVVANLYQVDIKIITTKGPEDKNPTINMINPNPELERYALLPRGIIHAMILIHFENNHFNLVISSKSRLFTNEVNQKQNENKTNNELQELRIKYENLKQLHEDCSKELEELKREKENSKMDVVENKNTAMEEHDNNEEEALVAMKDAGFIRIGPQSQSMRKKKSKTFTCPICQQMFKSDSTLKKHTEIHTTDGDWNCKKCSYQTNSEGNLKKHEKAAKHETVTEVPGGIRCNLCDKCFLNEDDIVIHKRNDHRSFKPCNNLPNCPYGTDCMFNHNPKPNKFTCYECGEEFEILRNLMAHRKKKHTMNTCEKFLKDECKRTQETCWYNHDKKEPAVNKSSEEDKKKSQETFQPPVFWERPANLAPPATLPNHATWLKMITMMSELNKMMTEMKNEMSKQL